jgi:preprotein translocase subunit SecE
MSGFTSLIITLMSSSVKPIIFLKEVKTELSKVVWPTRPQILKLTMVVIGTSVATGLFLGGVDYILTILMEVILKR